MGKVLEAESSSGVVANSFDLSKSQIASKRLKDAKASLVQS